MPDADSLCAELMQHRSLLPWADPDWVWPDYQGAGIANLPATVAALLGGELPGACPPLRRELWSGWGDDIQRVILVVLDALGYRQLRAAMKIDSGPILHRLVEAGRILPLTSTFPSTTCTALTSLWTGYAPAAHGSLAFEVFLREIGTAASLLFFWPISFRQRDSLAGWGLDAAQFIPLPGLAARLSAQGVYTCALLDKSFASSMFTQTLQRGVDQAEGFVSLGDMWLMAQRMLEAHQDQKLFLGIYGATIDGITHQHSPDDPSWLIELRLLFQAMQEGFLARLTPGQRRGTLLLITADHGGISTTTQDAVQLKHHVPLHDALICPPLGEGRTPFFYTRGDTQEQVISYIGTHLRDSFVALTRQQVLDSDLLGPGPMYQETPHRLGDVVALARGHSFLARDDHQLKMKGRHGGLAAQEMLVPLIGVRLDAL